MLEYNLDIMERKIQIAHTPNSMSKNLSFYVEGIGFWKVKKDYYTKRSGMNSFLLLFTVEGKGYLEYENFANILVPNSVAIINCNKYHLYRTYENRWTFRYIHFNGIACTYFVDMIHENTNELILLTSPEKIEHFFKLIQKTIENKDIQTDLKNNLYLTNILTEIACNRVNQLNVKNYHVHIEEITQYIQYVKNNFDQPFDIENFIQSAHISKYHFIRLFKKHTGITPYEYFIQYRINKAKKLLTETNYSVDEISYKTGFSDANHFIRNFKKIVGMTPLKYRKYSIM